MKKLLIAMTAIFFLITGSLTYAEEEVVYIPDPHFKEYLVNFPAPETPEIDVNMDGEIQISEAESYSGWLIIEGEDISDLTGLQTFSGVFDISLKNMKLSYLDISEMQSLADLTLSDIIADSINISGCKNIGEITATGISCELIDIRGGERLYSCKLNNIDKRLNHIEGLEDCIYLAFMSIKNSSIRSLPIESLPRLVVFESTGNQFLTIDLSNKTKLTKCTVEDESVLSLSVRNGNNTRMDIMKVRNCPELDCIEVDNPKYSEANWRNGDTTNFKFDAQIVFSTDCNSCLREMEQTQISIYPNPAGEYLYIAAESEKIMPYEIIDIKGETVQSGELVQTRGVTKVDLNLLVKGTYFVRIGESTKKFIKK
jgi:hypothetical protein